MPADLPARLARRAPPGDLLRAQHENGFQGVALDFVNHILHHLAGAFDQVDDGQQDLPVTLTELLDQAADSLAARVTIWYGFFTAVGSFLGFVFGNRILSKPAPPPLPTFNYGWDTFMPGAGPA